MKNINIKIENLKKIIQEIKEDNEWVNDSHTKSQYVGMCQGLDMLLIHFEGSSKEK